MKTKLLDLFCRAGGAGKGYIDAGFDVTGVDIEPMPDYPGTFIQTDAIAYLAAHGHEYDAIHTSPPLPSIQRPHQRHKQRPGIPEPHPRNQGTPGTPQGSDRD